MLLKRSLFPNCLESKCLFLEYLDELFNKRMASHLKSSF